MVGFHDSLLVGAFGQASAVSGQAECEQCGTAPALFPVAEAAALSQHAMHRLKQEGCAAECNTAEECVMIDH